MNPGFSATSTKSVQQARRNLTKLIKSVDNLPKNVLEVEARRIKREEISMVPYRSGKLERSVYCRVSRDKRNPGIVTGASARSKKGYNYAGIQHEVEEFHHDKGSHHYISVPLEKGIARIDKKIRRMIESAFK